jgi:hypothetical protein
VSHNAQAFRRLFPLLFQPGFYAIIPEKAVTRHRTTEYTVNQNSRTRHYSSNGCRRVFVTSHYLQDLDLQGFKNLLISKILQLSTEIVIPAGRAKRGLAGIQAPMDGLGLPSLTTTLRTVHGTGYPLPGGYDEFLNIVYNDERCALPAGMTGNMNA